MKLQFEHFSVQSTSMNRNVFAVNVDNLGKCNEELQCYMTLSPYAVKAAITGLIDISNVR